MILLHEFALSSASYRVRIALAMKGIAYQSRSYTLRRQEHRSAGYLAINPVGLVPCLEIDGLRLTQSLAIIDYLDQRFPEPRLIPAEPAERARVQAMAQTIACDIHPIDNLRVLHYLEAELGQDEAARNRWYAHWIHAGFEGLEAMARAEAAGPFLTGEAPGLFEICLVPQVFNARRFAVDLSPYGRLVEMADRALALPAFAKAAPA
ncbi:maleylacetoacetate isomerase [Rhizorhabdus wittichii]|uniref:maleylacetoacetate isomerase n=1 Tax=Rhizorhabdus wittichii TaxID=160791 RepID=UPI00030468E5|nr:maleylacetoacetate isomerase [Rhizorhabdus wittichii]